MKIDIESLVTKMDNDKLEKAQTLYKNLVYLNEKDILTMVKLVREDSTENVSRSYI